MFFGPPRSSEFVVTDHSSSMKRSTDKCGTKITNRRTPLPTDPDSKAADAKTALETASQNQSHHHQGSRGGGASLLFDNPFLQVVRGDL